ncbi:protein transport protein SEC31 [Capsella rubella]|uniref:protein transport protein SEC31 n=1 Tax=Capsella rubella TaxID=81985 RepID=UPI000CD53F0B|nr:protein transport protein SEC31 [Capsella rubella]
MDPSLSISCDSHHHPPQFTPFPPFPASNPFGSGGAAAINPLGPNPYHPNNHIFQPQPQTQTQNPQPPMIPHPSLNHPPYSEVLWRSRFAALNEPDGSSKMAISRYIERCYTGLLPSAHPALLTHNLKTLKSSGVLAMVKKSYKFAVSSSPPESVAVAAAAAAQGLDVPRSDILNSGYDPRAVSASGSASQPLKRGRGRPPKPKPEAQPQPLQAISGQSNGQPSWQQQQSGSPVPRPTEASPVPVTESAKRGPGRPRKNGAAASAGPIVQASVMAGIMKRRGRPPGRRAAGRQRKPKSVSATASVYPYVANGARRRGRPRRVVDPSSVVAVAPAGGEIGAAVAPGMKRGRGRPPKIGGVISRLMKPKRGRGRPVGRPRKIATSVTTGTQDSGELKKKLDVFQEKVKEIVKVLKDGVTSDNPAVVQAIKDLEGLTVMETVEPQAMDDVQPQPMETAAPHTESQIEAAETQGEQEQGQERDEGEAQTQTQTQIQTEAEAMQEALF